MRAFYNEDDRYCALCAFYNEGDRRPEQRKPEASDRQITALQFDLNAVPLNAKTSAG